MTKNPLAPFGNIPVTTDILHGCFPGLSAPQKKIEALEADGQLIKLKRGLYVVSPEVTGKPLSAPLCANHLYGPSYVSLQWALRWYGLIPERVFTTTSVTSQYSKVFTNKLGTFSYYHVSLPYLSIGVRSMEVEGTFCLMASPEKAMCDTILTDSYLPPQSQRRLYQYLEEDIRFDTDALSDFDISIIEQCANTGRKSVILQNLIKIIKTIKR